jgi:hypothetical protein
MLKCCSIAYDAFLELHYGINSQTIKVFYQTKRYENIVYDNKIKKIDSRYIPAYILKQCKKKYEAYTAKNNFKPTEEFMCQILKDQLRKNKRIDKIPSELFTHVPKNTENRITEIIEIYRELKNQGIKYILENFNKYQIYLRCYYDTKPTDFSHFQQPVSIKQLRGNFKKFTIQQDQNKCTFTLIPPEFTVSYTTIQKKQAKFNKKPKMLTIEAKYQLMFKGLKPNEFIKAVLSQNRMEAEFPREYTRQLAIPEFVYPTTFSSITDMKCYYITAKRRYHEYGLMRDLQEMNRIDEKIKKTIG